MNATLTLDRSRTTFGGARVAARLPWHSPHVWDVAANRPAAGVASATVYGPDRALADALVTGLVAAGSAGFDSVTGAGYQALLVLDDGNSISTAEFLTPSPV